VRTASILGVVTLGFLVYGPHGLWAEQVPVRQTEGLAHGFLSLKTQRGTTLADGELLQTARGDRVTSRLVFHFADGSVSDETTVFSQRGRFELISDHMVQKGRSFRTPVDMSIERASGHVVVHYADDDGEQKTADEHMQLPGDLANGMVLTLLKNVGSAPPQSVSMVLATPKPRLVKVKISAAGQDSFSTGRTLRKATHYILKVDIGGLAGLLAPLVGKQPPDSHVWILGGEAPVFIKSEVPFSPGAEPWRIEQVSPAWK
jgi:hypothetical protein